MGAICKWCLKDMVIVNTCTDNEYIEFPNGETLKSIPYEFDDPEHRCHDCNVQVGENHHPGCDMEQCPRCGGQLISCGCLDSEGDE